MEDPSGTFHRWVIMMNINEPTSSTLQVRRSEEKKKKFPESSAITRKLFLSVNTVHQLIHPDRLFQKSMVLFLREENEAVTYSKELLRKLRKIMYIKHLAPWLS